MENGASKTESPTFTDNAAGSRNTTNKDLVETVENGTQNSAEPVVIIEEEEASEKAPDGGWGWLIVLGSVIMHCLMGGFERSNGIVYQQFLDRFHGSATATAWVTSIFSTLRLILGPVTSALCTRFSCRTVVMVGGVMAMASLILSGYANSLGFLYFSYGVLGGVGRAMTYTPSLIIVGYYFNKRRGLAVGLATSGVGLGTFILPPLMEILFDFYGFAGAFLILGSIALNFCISAALFRPLDLHHRILRNERRIRRQSEQKSFALEANQQLLNGPVMVINGQNRPLKLLDDQPASQLASSMDITAAIKIEHRRPSLFKRQWNKFRKSYRDSSKEATKRPFIEWSLLKNLRFLALCFAILLFTIAFNSTFVFLPSLASARGVTKLEAAYLVSILGIFDALSRIAMSSILDLKRVKPYRLYVYNIIIFLTGAVSLSFPAMSTFPELLLMCCLYGILSGSYISQKSVVIVDILGIEKLASSFGILLMFQGIGSFIGPPVGGLIKDYVGTYDGAFFVGSAGTFLGGFVLVLGNLWEHRRKKKELNKETGET